MTTRREFLIGAGAGLVALGAGKSWSHPPSRWGSSGSSGQYQLELPFAVTPALTTDKFEFRVWKAGPYALTVESAELHPQRR